MEERIKLIYILGASYSGSTILSGILGSDRKALNLGEVKQLPSFMVRDVKCACGDASSNCPFWSKLVLDYSQVTVTPPLSKRISNYWHLIISPGKWNNKESLDYTFFQELLSQTSSTETKILVDASKSPHRLLALVRDNRIDLTVVHLTRSFKSVLSSYKKYKNKAVLPELLKLWITRKSENGLLKKYKIPSLAVDFDEICIDPKNHIQQIGEFTKLNLDDYLINIRNRQQHINTGNKSRFQLSESFEGLVRKKTNSNLSKVQEAVIRLFDH